jgi:CysZ protein
MSILKNNKPQHIERGWTPFLSSSAFMFRHIRVLGWSLLLVIVTGGLTWLGYLEAIQLVDKFTGNFFQLPPEGSGVVGWLTAQGWLILKYLFLMVSRIAAFYLAFLTAYCITTPGYVFLSGMVEKIYGKQTGKPASGFKPQQVLIDLLEGIKIGAVGILVTIAALAVNFVPVIGQLLVFLLYVFYSTLMFIDYPASNRSWSLGQKIGWIKTNFRRSFRLGVFPALISMVPIINVFFMALFFPLFTVHSTLNFLSTLER